ncbi:MAG: hypothetical protein U1E33_02480 [Rhodospirillales bacterium]
MPSVSRRCCRPSTSGRSPAASRGCAGRRGCSGWRPAASGGAAAGGLRELWLDGGHNAAAQVLASHLRGWRDRPVHLVFGMLRSKDAACPHDAGPWADDMVTVAIPGEAASLGADEAAAIACGCGHRAAAAESVAASLRRHAPVRRLHSPHGS